MLRASGHTRRIKTLHTVPVLFLLLPWITDNTAVPAAVVAEKTLVGTLDCGLRTSCGPLRFLLLFYRLTFILLRSVAEAMQSQDAANSRFAATLDETHAMITSNDDHGLSRAVPPDNNDGPSNDGPSGSHTNTMRAGWHPRPSHPCSIPMIDLTCDDDEHASDLTLGFSNKGGSK